MEMFFFGVALCTWKANLRSSLENIVLKPLVKIKYVIRTLHDTMHWSM
jgi:hypothetical protein